MTLSKATQLRIVGILLAAGQGSRFGGGKLLATLADGVPLGIRSARNLRSALAEIVVVTRPEDAQLRTLLAAEGMRAEICPQAQEGMGASLAHGVRATHDADAWVVALGDMPEIQPTTIQRISAALEGGAAIVAPSYAGKRGHPVGFSHEFVDALCALSGDAGAREILRAHAQRIALIDCDDPGVLADIDTPADLARIGGRDS